MSAPHFMAFLPELVLLAGALVLFVLCVVPTRLALARGVALATAIGATGATLLVFGSTATLFDGAYQVDRFSQTLKLVFTAGFALQLLLQGRLPDIRESVKPEYFLFLTLSVSGLTMLVSCVELIALLVALQLSAFPVYLLVAMRNESEHHRQQMESAIKYIMFGVAANGIMLFGMSYLFGLTGTTSWPTMIARLQPVLGTPLAVTGLALMFCGLFYKLAIFPFHFWTPDVYQGASNETTGYIASLPKLGAVAILARFTALAPGGHPALTSLLTGLAVASMIYGNLLALTQNDLKRLFGFSAIAHAGYAVIGFVAFDRAGLTAALYYMTGYLLMVMAGFVVIGRVSKDGANVPIEDLAGLHRRSPLLAVTLVVGVFALAGIPPFAGFTGKLALLTAAFAKGHLTLVIIAVINTAIAVYYYLRIVREALFRDAGDHPAIALDVGTRILCVVLIAGIILLGVAPARVFEAISGSLGFMPAGN